MNSTSWRKGFWLRWVGHLLGILFDYWLRLLGSLVPSKVIQDTLKFFIGFPLFYLLISLDRWFFPSKLPLTSVKKRPLALSARLNPFIEFPRSTQEILDRGETLFQLIKEYQQQLAAKQRSSASNDGSLRHLCWIPQNSKFVSLKLKQDDPLSEANKLGVQVSFFDLTFTSSTGQTTIPLFIKIPSARRLPTVVRVLHAIAMKRGMEHRVVDDVFPTLMSSPSSTRTPKILACFGNRAFQHHCIVSEMVPQQEWRGQTDGKGMTGSQVEALVTASAELHAHLWLNQTRQGSQRVCDEQEAEKNGLRSQLTVKNGWSNGVGLDWIGFLIPLCFTDKQKDRHKCPPWVPSLWWTLEEFFRSSTTCLSHGDCRSGNMLFSTPASNLDSKVIMTDWELCNLCPSSWDFMYSIVSGLPPYERRLRQRDLFELHWVKLKESLGGKKCGGHIASVGCKNASVVPSLASEQALMPSPRTRPHFDYGVETLKDRVELETDLTPVLMFYFYWLIAQTGNAGDTQGTNVVDGAVWGERIRAAILDSFLCPGAESTDPDGFRNWTEPHDLKAIDPNGCRKGEFQELNTAFQQVKNQEDQWKRLSFCSRCGAHGQARLRTMEDLNIISPTLGNILPQPSPVSKPAHANRVRRSADGEAVFCIVEPAYHKMHLNYRLVSVLDPYLSAWQGKKILPYEKCRNVEEDLLEMIQYCSSKQFVKDVTVGRIAEWKMDAFSPIRYQR